MRITTETERCVGAGQCVLAAPEVFDQHDDGTVLVRTRRPPPDERDRVVEAVQRCPSLTISIDEDPAEDPDTDEDPAEDIDEEQD